MRYCAWFVVAFLSATLVSAADKKLPIEQTSNELVDISANALLEKDQIRQELGSDLGGDIVVVRVTFKTVSDKPIALSLDDFLLVSGKDGQRSQPYSPSQIAGSTTLVVTPSGTRNGGLAGQGNGPIWGGIPGTTSAPQRMPGNGGGVGSTTSGASSGDSKVETVQSKDVNPLLAVLQAKILPEKDVTTESISGLLYFQIVGKLKSKDLELHYRGPGGRLALRFRP